MNNLPLVSLIIPTYNRSYLLERAISHAFNQNYSNLEVIVSNNASSDNTTEILAKLNVVYPKLKVYNHHKILSLNVHWDLIITNYAKGDFLIIIPDDDILTDSNYIQDSVAIFNKYLSIGIVFANYKIISHDYNLISQINAEFNEFIDKAFLYKNYNKCLFNIIGIGIPHLTAVFSRDAYIKSGGFNIDCLSPDTYLWLKIMLFYDLGFIKKSVASYMLHNQNITKTSNLSQKYKDTLIVKNVKKLLSKSNLNEELALNTLARIDFKFLSIYFYNLKIFLKREGIKNTLKYVHPLTIIRYVYYKFFLKRLKTF